MSTIREKASSCAKTVRGGCDKLLHQRIFRYAIAQIYALALLMNFVIECFSRSSVWKALVYTFGSPLVFLTNTLIVAILIAPSVFSRRRGFFYFFTCILWLTVGVIDFVLLHHRVTPFNANDFHMLGDAVDVAIHYYSPIQLIGLILLIAFGIGLVVYAFIKFPKREQKVNYLSATITCVAVILGGFLLIQVSILGGVMAKSFPNLAQGYYDYGLPYCFVSSIVDTGIDKPDDYSPDSVDNIVGPLGSTTPSVTLPVSTPDSAPNIVFIQLESFFDPKRISGLEFETDPIPTFSMLRKNYTSGLLTVPSISAGTANTEFEILTGMNMADFGTGEYPYKTILKETTTESIAYNLRKLGYSAHAIHNNTATFYSRHIVYGNLGFETFAPIELMTDVEMTELDWAKDSVLYDQIRYALDSTPHADLVFTVSVQGHGGYPDEDILSDAIDLKDIHDAYDDNTIYGLKYYIMQLNEMDALIARLIEYFQKSDEPTVLVLYGDHLPGFDFEDANLNEGSLLQTEYVIWSNFEMKVEHRDLYAYQLSAYVMNRIGYSEGLITKLHQTHLNANEPDYLNQLNLLSYDMLYGKQYCWNGVNPYAPSNLTFGFRDIVISDVHTIYDAEEDTYYLQVFGRNFTPYMDIYINGKRYKQTVYVSERELFLADLSLENNDEIVVAAPINEETNLRESSPYLLYHLAEMTE